MPRTMGPPGGPRGYLTEEEKKNAPKITKSLLLRILSYLKPYRLQFAGVFVAILLGSILGLLPSIIMGRIVDEALLGKDFTLLLQLLLAALITLLASQIIGVLESYINAWIGQRIVFDMKNQMYKHLQSMPHSFFTTEKQGDIITRMNSDIAGVSGVISNTLTSAVSNLAIVLTTTIALFTLNWQLAFVGIAIIPLLVIPTKEVGITRFKLLQKAQESNDEINQHVDETLSVSGSLLVKLFTREKMTYDRFTDINSEVTRLTLKEERSGKWFRMLMGMFTQIGPLLIYLAGGILLIRYPMSGVTVGVITAVIALVNRLYRPVQTLLDLQVGVTRSMALFTRIFDYLDQKSTLTESVHPQNHPIQHQDIVFDHVHFSYSAQMPILKDLSFQVPGGTMAAVVGASGSGKSTLVNLIPRLYDVDAGFIKIGNVDVRDFSLHYLRSQIGMVTQDTYLLNGTIKENLLWGKPDADMPELEAACKAANIYDFIVRQPDGFDTLVGNRGLKLSGGEKQRLSIARVVLKDPAILILDEATSSLDSISENAIQDALEQIMHNRTSIVIAHRLSTVLAADIILVVADGSIVQKGTHDDLLAQGGIYKELYETQFKKILEHESAL